jgi:hypothetical protein
VLDSGYWILHCTLYAERCPLYAIFQKEFLGYEKNEGVQINPFCLFEFSGFEFV